MDLAGTATGPVSTLGAPTDRLRAGPPGLLFYAVTSVAVVAAVDANTRQSLSTLLLVAPLWLSLAGAWLLRLVIAGNRRRWEFTPVEWIRWVGIPLVMGTAFFVTRTDVLIDTRLELSRGAMNAMAAEVMAGGSLERGWVGLYDVGTVDLTENGLRFVVDDSGLYRWGYAYSPEGKPSFIETEDEVLDWQGARFESIGDGWWDWTQSWD